MVFNKITKEKIISITLFFNLLFLSLDNISREYHYILGTNIIKNIFFAITLILSLGIVLKKYRINGSFKFLTVFVNCVLLCIVLMFLSILASLLANKYSLISLKMGFKIILPCLYVFLIVNVLEKKVIEKILTINFLICFISYILSIGIHNFTAENLLSINYLHSYSQFESNMFSPTAMGYFLFFVLLSKKHIFKILSLFFVLLTFKRIMVVYAIFLFIIYPIIKTKKFNIKHTLIIITILTLIIILYFNLMRGSLNGIIENITGISFNNLVMGRDYLFNQLISTNSISYGLGSSMEISQNIEMDFIQFIWEVTLFGAIAFVSYLVSIAKENKQAIFIALFIYLEMLTSHWYDITYFWVFAYLIIALEDTDSVTLTISEVICKKIRSIVDRLEGLYYFFENR